MMNKPSLVLMAEDNEYDVLATERAWKKNRIANPLQIVNDGEECLDYLKRRGKYSDPDSAPRPGWILLDVNMPKIDGFTVLERIRADEELRLLPVVMLTTSRAEEDRTRGYGAGANAYVVKPIGSESFSAAIKTIQLFWQLAELPG